MLNRAGCAIDIAFHSSRGEYMNPHQPYQYIYVLAPKDAASTSGARRVGHSAPPPAKTSSLPPPTSDGPANRCNSEGNAWDRKPAEGGGFNQVFVRATTWAPTRISR
ncbi:hypothetical protein V2G26_012367 [Clonostachys chloroleuca]